MVGREISGTIATRYFSGANSWTSHLWLVYDLGSVFWFARQDLEQTSLRRHVESYALVNDRRGYSQDQDIRPLDQHSRNVDGAPIACNHPGESRMEVDSGGRDAV